jgi:sialate O-acetylesterase
MNASRVFAVFSLLWAGIWLRADVSLAPVFSDHAVLQRDKPLPIWGHAEPGERVTVSFADQTVGTTAAADGRWIVYLAPLTASATSTELVVAGKNTLRLRDVVVGDVWLCSGQSNMEWPVAEAANAAEEIRAANNPQIRHLKIACAVADEPRTTAAVEKSGWVVSAPETVGEFTAVGYFFARDLQPRVGVPIGLINSSWGGTQIEAWMSPPSLASDPASAVIAERWEKMRAAIPEEKARYDEAFAAWSAAAEAAKAKGATFNERPPRQPRAQPKHQPTGLHNAMIAPLLPVALRGVLWYQGESNAARAGEYVRLFPALITGWREHLGQGELPFFWVQLANFANGDAKGVNWAALREAQAKTLALPATGQAVTIDIGERDDIHPRNKQEVGRRLALLARAKIFGGAVDFSGPVFRSATREGAALRVSFEHAGSGLIARDQPLQEFQIAGADKKFFPTTAKIEGETVLVSAAEVPAPVAVRYAWRNAPEVNFYNGAGLPAAPFRSDDW